MLNLQIRQFRDSIIALTNASTLPIEVKRLVFNEIQSLIESETEKAIAAERQELQRQEAEKHSKEENNTERGDYNENE